MAAAAGKRAFAGGGARIGESGKYEGAFQVQQNAPFVKHRIDVWEKLFAKHKENIEKEEKKPIKVELPDGKVIEGKAFVTTPFEIAMGISKGLAEAAVVAKVIYKEPIASLKQVVAADHDESDNEEAAATETSVLWDLTRPLEGSCRMELLKFDHPQGQDVFWHSSAHILGEAMEKVFGCHLTIGPALESGFYYDGYFGDRKLNDKDFADIEAAAAEISKEQQPFERCVLTKAEALELFSENPFKVQLITNKVPEGAMTSCYRCGNLIDLCRGPHLPNTGRAKAFMVTKNSAAYWLGDQKLDSLQRLYGIAFPSSQHLKDYKKFQEEAAKRDHRNIGTQQGLFMQHPLYSPGSTFWFPMGAKIYNKLIAFMKQEYRVRGFTEVITPNMYTSSLFMVSGHYQNYKDDMYSLNVEKEEWMLKPMNCPGHFLMFDNGVRSYKDMPIRYADFGVLHRNEHSGALSGLTRVRRFQQDDAHILCRPDQIKSEVMAALDFLSFVYAQFGFQASFALSTRPKKALGSKEIWDNAEAQLKAALDDFGKEWSLNPGDGAFYGPKIDIRLTDAMKRKHQCGTIQLDFNNPIRFNLQYRKEGADEPTEAADDEDGAENKKQKAQDDKKKDKGKDKGKEKQADKEKEKATEKEADKEKAGDKDKAADDKNAGLAVEKNAKGEVIWREGRLKTGFERPVVIHRAILGSVERMSAILMEHYAGKWPFWLSPRQVMVTPISEAFNEYAIWVKRQLHLQGFEAEADVGGNTLKKKIRNAQVEQWNYCCVVGEKEKATLSVNLRIRDSEDPLGVFTMPQLIAKFLAESMPTSQKISGFEAFEGRNVEVAPPAAVAVAAAGASNPSARASLKRPGTMHLEVEDDVEAYLEHHPYVKGFAPGKADRELHEQLSQSGVPQTPHLRRWFEHVSSFTRLEREAWA